jgi:uncharacterized protein (TIGR02996 family)
VATCPRCGSSKVLGKKFGFGDVTLYEFSCSSCDLFEEKKDTDPDFADWYARWSSSSQSMHDGPPATPVARSTAATSAPASSGPVTLAAPGTVVPTAPDPNGPDLRKVTAAPHDDAPRLAYAAAIKPHRPERAEFIRLQLDRFAAERASGALTGNAGLRESDIRQRFGKEWAGPIAAYARPYTTDGKYRGWEFERGFVALIRTDPDIVVDDRTSHLFELAPIEHLAITADGPVRQVLTSPHLARMRSLELSHLGLGDDDARLLATEVKLDRLEWLDLRGNNIGSQGVAALLSSAQIRAIPVVLLEGNTSDPAVQYNLDYDGSVMDSYLPAEGKDAEAKYGRINWLHLPHRGRPDLFHARAARYED